MKSINLIIDICSMGDSSETAMNAYTDEVKSAVLSAYPDANVTVKIGSYDQQKIHGFGIESDEIESNINDISSDVWENGNWHYVE